MIITPIIGEQAAKYCIYNDGTFYCKLIGDCCICWYNRRVCFDGKLKKPQEEIEEK